MSPKLIAGQATLDAPTVSRTALAASNARGASSRVKAAARVTRPARRTTQTEGSLSEELQDSINRNVPVKRYKGDAGQYIQAKNGRHIRLMHATNKATPAGKLYYEKLNVEPPSLYDYDQPLLDDKWVVARDGSKILVRKRDKFGKWKILKTGEAYFKYNRSEYETMALVFVARRPTEAELQRTVPAEDDAAVDGGWVIVKREASVYMPIPDYPTMSVGQIRAAMVGKNSLHAAPRQPNELGGTGDSHIGDADSSHIHHVEVKAATKAVLRKLPTLRGTDMETYHKLFYKSKNLVCMGRYHSNRQGASHELLGRPTPDN